MQLASVLAVAEVSIEFCMVRAPSRSAAAARGEEQDKIWEGGEMGDVGLSRDEDDVRWLRREEWSSGPGVFKRTAVLAVAGT